MTKLLIAVALVVSFSAPAVAGQWGPNPPAGYFSTR